SGRNPRHGLTVSPTDRKRSRRSDDINNDCDDEVQSPSSSKEHGLVEENIRRPIIVPTTVLSSNRASPSSKRATGGTGNFEGSYQPGETEGYVYWAAFRDDLRAPRSDRGSRGFPSPKKGARGPPQRDKRHWAKRRTGSRSPLTTGSSGRTTGSVGEGIGSARDEGASAADPVTGIGSTTDEEAAGADSATGVVLACRGYLGQILHRYLGARDVSGQRSSDLRFHATHAGIDCETEVGIPQKSDRQLAAGIAYSIIIQEHVKYYSDGKGNVTWHRPKELGPGATTACTRPQSDFSAIHRRWGGSTTNPRLTMDRGWTPCIPAHRTTVGHQQLSTRATTARARLQPDYDADLQSGTSATVYPHGPPRWIVPFPVPKRTRDEPHDL
ncbi:hypothetical protein THAOC_04506, partial [Thalassiosira oceanica]